MMDYLRDQGLVEISLGDCSRLISFFSSNADGKLNFADFTQMILPCEDPVVRAEASKRPYARVGRFDSLPQEIEVCVTRLIQHEVDLMRRLQICVRDLEHCCDFSL